MKVSSPILCIVLILLLGLQNTSASNTKKFRNESFSIEYPDDWVIIQREQQITENTTIGVQIMKIGLQENEFRPNVNIIKSKKRYSESTDELTSITVKQKQLKIPLYSLKERSHIILDQCTGTKTKQLIRVNGYNILQIQYIIKDRHGFVFTITGTLDETQTEDQLPTMEKIIQSFRIIGAIN